MAIQPMDANSFDVIENVPLIPDNLINYEELEAQEEFIKNQYIYFNNLGVNLIDGIDVLYQKDIYANLLNYVNDNYISIVDYDASSVITKKLSEVGEMVYNFICVDCFNTIIPNFLNYANIISLDGFDSLIQNKYKGDYSIVKANLVKITQNIIDELLKLQKLNPTVKEDIMYQKLLLKYSYYIELIDFGNTEEFVTKYIRPLLIKNLDSILWRTS